MKHLNIERFQEQLNTIISESELPVGVVLLLMQKTTAEIQWLYEQQLKIEKEQEEKENE